MEARRPSGSELKIQEYITRIQGGESEESILEGLPPSFVNSIKAGIQESEKVIEKATTKDKVMEQKEDVSIPPQYQGLDADTLEFIWVIPEYIDREKTEKEKRRKQQAVDSLRKNEANEVKIANLELARQAKIEEVKKNLGIDSDTPLQTSQTEHTSLEKQNGNHLLEGAVKYVCQGRKQAVIDLYNNLLSHSDEPESRQKLASGLFQDIYNKYRIAAYPHDPNEEQIWDDALRNTNVNINNKKSEWMYRGVFPTNSEETVTRGSFNVHVTPELINQLDNMISSGKIKANYKFGQPGTSASPTERHDSISIYFLEQPTPEALKELTSITRPYVRGDNLLGKKIDDGFYMSEIGSIDTEHINVFIEQLKSKDAAFAQAVQNYTSPQPGRDSSLKMSEAQYYAIKDVARAFGYNISYDREKGFEIA